MNSRIFSNMVKRENLYGFIYFRKIFDKELLTGNRDHLQQFVRHLHCMFILRLSCVKILRNLHGVYCLCPEPEPNFSKVGTGTATNHYGSTSKTYGTSLVF
jgi:hypothetical protein